MFLQKTPKIMNFIIIETFLIVIQTSKHPNVEGIVSKDEKIDEERLRTSLPSQTMKRQDDNFFIDETSKLFQSVECTDKKEDSSFSNNLLGDENLSQDDSESLSLDASFDYDMFNYDLDSIYFDNNSPSIHDKSEKTIDNVKEVKSNNLINENYHKLNEPFYQNKDRMNSEPGCSTQFNNINTVGFGVQPDIIPFKAYAKRLTKSSENSYFREIPCQEEKVLSTVVNNDGFSSDFTDEDNSELERNSDSLESQEVTDESEQGKSKCMFSFFSCFSD